MQTRLRADPLSHIRHRPAEDPALAPLYAKLLTVPHVKKALACQRADGFFGTVIHGCYYGGFDATVDWLKRHGVETSHPAMVRARDCLERWGGQEADHFYKAGHAMDEHGRGGFDTLVARLLLDLGAEESLPLIVREIERALASFRGALSHRSVDDFTRRATFRGEACRYYIKGAPFPDAAFIDLLQKTRSWRTADNLDMVRRSYLHCEALMRDYSGGQIYINCGHFVGPFNHHWQKKSPRIAPASLRDFDAAPIEFTWFMKGLSQCGTLLPLSSETPEHEIIGMLARFLAELPEGVTEKQLHYFKQHLALEPSWRKAESVACDLAFPILLELSRCGVKME